jgi:hypothetical protein
LKGNILKKTTIDLWNTLEFEFTDERFKAKALPEEIYSDLKFCFRLAREYCFNADLASIQTKPVLTYYSMMNLVIGYCLMKKKIKISAFKKISNSHGMKFYFDNYLSRDRDLFKTLGAMSINIQSGTFSVWRNLACYPKVYATSNHPIAATRAEVVDTCELDNVIKSYK